MRKLQALTSFLLTSLNLPREKVDSFADQGGLIPSVTDLGHGLRLGMFKYEAVITIENFKGDAALLLTSVLAWLMDNDPEREAQGLTDPEVDATELDAKHFDIELSVEFEEALEVVPDASGPLTFRGQLWRVSDVPIDVAEELVGMTGHIAKDDDDA